MRRTPILSILGLALVAMVPAAPAAGQTVCELNHTADCSTDVIAEVQSVGTVTLGPPPIVLVDEAALNLGYADATPLDYTIQTNDAWSLSLHASQSTWGGPTDTSKPIGDLFWSSDASTYTAVTLTAAEIATGLPTGPLPGQIFFQSNWDWQDPPGLYSATILLTFSSL